ncbi:molecular chaperone DnaJ [Exiguobacterium aestuarii]|uniref:Chaperone protein DnaJ n=1 Tax=Exiguobacterium aestuarii TaxID=273527 RepID=A0ABW2PJ93_9BACL|nr:molecular chaperone DnaJ [Exiguobacterium aestuarii]MCT4786807.1 molecular chaperone DnaJ [Exiguobacterium aestuarii]
MAKRDYYEVLGLDKSASAQEIKRAYRKLARQYHPDINQEADAADKFKEIGEAYEVLSDEQKRAQYDRFGFEGANQFGGGGDFQGGFGDIFDMFFGGGGRRQDPNAPRRGEDYQYVVDLDFMESVTGKTETIELEIEVECDTCMGNGAKPGTKPETCNQCGGSGVETVEQNTILGRMVNQRPCSKCHGSGKTIKEKCPTCHGSGHVKKKQTVEVKIPAGIDNGQQIRLSGKGGPGVNGGPAGDLYVVVRVKAHEIFERVDQHIAMEMPVTFAQAALGAEIEVPTVHGNVSLKVPAGTQTGSKFRLRGKGMPSVRGGANGDQYVSVVVMTPKNMTDRQKELLREFEEISGESGVEEEHGMFQKMKKFFSH